MENTIATELYNKTAEILDKYYTPWHRIAIKEDKRVLVETLNTISSIMYLEEADNIYYSVETSLWNRRLRQYRRLLLVGYFTTEADVSSQLLKNILSIETDLEGKDND